jgi:hypothetical protein
MSLLSGTGSKVACLWTSITYMILFLQAERRCKVAVEAESKSKERVADLESKLAQTREVILGIPHYCRLRAFRRPDEPLRYCSIL